MLYLLFNPTQVFTKFQLKLINLSSKNLMEFTIKKNTLRVLLSQHLFPSTKYAEITLLFKKNHKIPIFTKLLLLEI